MCLRLVKLLGIVRRHEPCAGEVSCGGASEPVHARAAQRMIPASHGIRSLSRFRRVEPKPNIEFGFRACCTHVERFPINFAVSFCSLFALGCLRADVLLHVVILYTARGFGDVGLSFRLVPQSWQGGHCSRGQRKMALLLQASFSTSSLFLPPLPGDEKARQRRRARAPDERRGLRLRRRPRGCLGGGAGREQADHGEVADAHAAKRRGANFVTVALLGGATRCASRLHPQHVSWLLCVCVCSSFHRNPAPLTCRPRAAHVPLRCRPHAAEVPLTRRSRAHGRSPQICSSLA